MVRGRSAFGETNPDSRSHAVRGHSPSMALVADAARFGLDHCMVENLFTVVSDFRGTTSSLQVYAADEQDAVLAWAQLLSKERHFGRASGYIARAFQSWSFLAEATAVNNQSNVWAAGASCGGDHVCVTIVKTCSPTDDH